MKFALDRLKFHPLGMGGGGKSQLQYTLNRGANTLTIDEQLYNIYRKQRYKTDISVCVTGIADNSLSLLHNYLTDRCRYVESNGH